jgi:hypothetical protein
MSKRTADGAPPTKRNGSRRVTRSLDKSLACAFCHSEIPLIADHVVVYPCQCNVCPRCLLELLSPRGTADVDCLACGTPIHSHQFHRARAPDAKVVKCEQPQQKQQPPPEPQQIDDKSWLRHPLRSFVTMNRSLFESPPDEACELTLMYGLRYSKAANESKWTFERCIVPLTKIGAGIPGQGFCSAVRQFGAFLFKTITQSSKKAYSEMKAMAPDEFIKQKVQQLTPLTILRGHAGDRLANRQKIKDANQQKSGRILISGSSGVTQETA